MNINTLHPETDLKTVSYDLEKHNWAQYWLEIAQEKFPEIVSLETVHEHLSATEILSLARYCQSVCGSDEFTKRVDAYYSDIVKNHIGFEEWMIQRYFTIRIVIPNQAKKGRLLQFHQGIWVGNGLGLRTIWTPFTETYDSNSMFICSHDDSVDITQKTYQNKWDYDTIQSHCLNKSKPISLKPGEAFLFQQQHIHGNVNNETNITRWSMDGRILPKGGFYHRKLPGGYFRFLNEKESSVRPASELKWISYAAWNTEFSNGIPLPMQRGIINSYCSKFGIDINDYSFENEFCDWLPSLQKFIVGYNIDGIVLCSIYSLPSSSSRRKEILNLAIENNVELHFANELAVVKSESDINHIEKIFEYINENPDPNTYLNIKN